MHMCVGIHKYNYCDVEYRACADIYFFSHAYARVRAFMRSCVLATTRQMCDGDDDDDGGGGGNGDDRMMMSGALFFFCLRATAFMR